MSDDSKFVTGQVLAVDGGWSVSDGQVAVEPAPEAATPQTYAPSPGLVRKLATWWIKLSR